MVGHLILDLDSPSFMWFCMAARNGTSIGRFRNGGAHSTQSQDLGRWHDETLGKSSGKEQPFLHKIAYTHEIRAYGVTESMGPLGKGIAG